MTARTSGRDLAFAPSQNYGARRMRNSTSRWRWNPETYEGQVRGVLASWGHSLWLSLGERITAGAMAARGVMPPDCAIAIIDVRRGDIP